MITPQKEDLQELLAQEEELQFDMFSNEMAISLGLMMVEAAARDKLPAAIDITRSGQQLFFAGLSGTKPDNAFWIRRKMNLVNRYRHSSFYIGCKYRAEGTDFFTATGLPDAEYAAHGGCFPIQIRGTGFVGTLTVSGLPQAEDHAFAVQSLRAFKASMSQPRGSQQ